ncbi:MAG: ATP phosphoribosyltransferase regulatory subunit [Thiolinea sp.]
MSTSDQYWALPDGITEALPEEAARLEYLRREILDLYATWGYQLVMPPLVEFVQSLTTGVGSSLDVQTFRITDQYTGRMMGLRADMTPQIARIDAHKLQTEHPNRLCYIGSVLHTRALREGGSRSPLQVGAELFGHAGLDSDFEILSLLLATLEYCNVKQPTLDIGHVGIFRELASQAGFDHAQENTFFDMLERKSLPEIDAWLAASGLPEHLSRMLAVLPRLHGPIAILDEAKQALQQASPPVQEALDYLQALGERLQAAFPACNLHVDLTELSGYDYHTGIVYAVYSPDSGHEIARGGRYDGVGKWFGRARPATGFSTDLRLLSGSATPAAAMPQRIFAPADHEAPLEQLIADLRRQGRCVVRQLQGTTQTARQADCNYQIIQDHGQWTVTEV